ncbi:MAG TPA: ester cyclase [Polyangiales bacterium]|jgi:predicted ester cyclase|nr:ester cyclase [Polyangiales bacterium]
MANLSEQRKLVERYVAAYATGDTSKLDEIIAPSFVDHTHPDFSGPQGVAAGIRYVHEGLSDVQIVLDQIVCEANSVAFMVTASGTHTGEFGGKPPTGNRVVWKLVDFVRIEGGKFAELHNVSDNVSLMLGIGAQIV